ncbi:adenylyltransferase/cytidyltransferase family protein [Proteus mirabilis]|nr:adenylyltransferase/cytidyltransferase family protein [Proteus mirabilis]
MNIGYTSGIFDLFHEGHENYLSTCKKLCDFLIVGVDSDYRTKQLKGNDRPIDSIGVRLKNVSFHCDYVFEKTKSSNEYIKIYKPNIFFRSTDNLKHSNINIYTIYIQYTKGVSTTLLISDLG